MELLLLPDSALVLRVRRETSHFNIHGLIISGADYAALERSHGANWGEISVALVVVVGGGGGGFGGDDGVAMDERG